MKEYYSGDTISITSIQPTFKVKIGTGTATLQAQAKDEGFDTITNGDYSATADGEIKLKEVTLKIVLTGDARFFMSSTSNRHANG